MDRRLATADRVSVRHVGSDRTSVVVGLRSDCSDSGCSNEHGQAESSEAIRTAGGATTIADANLPSTTAQGALPTNFVVRHHDSPSNTDCHNPAEIVSGWRIRSGRAVIMAAVKNAMADSERGTSGMAGLIEAIERFIPGDSTSYVSGGPSLGRVGTAPHWPAAPGRTPTAVRCRLGAGRRMLVPTRTTPRWCSSP